MMLAPAGAGSQLAQRVRPSSSMTHRFVDKSPEGSRQPRGETRTLARRLRWCLIAAALAVLRTLRRWGYLGRRVRPVAR
jgi:hypothetical protein